MIDRRKRLAGIVILFVLLLSVVTWIAVRNPEHPTVALPPESASGAPAPSISDTPFVVVAVPTTDAPIATSTIDAAAPPANPRNNVVAATTVPAEPVPPPPVASSAPSATAQATPPPIDAAVEAAPPPAPVVVASIQPPPPEPTGLASGRFRDTVGPMFRLVQVTCVVDGVAVPAGRAPGGMLFDRRLAPGNHSVSIVAEYQGSGAGVFSYLEGYRFRGQTSRAFSVRVDTTTQITVTAYEKGPMVPYEERLALRVDVR